MRRARETGRSARMVLLLMASHRSHRAPLESQEKNLHEMTSQGVVSERVRDMYAQEIEACYRESGQIARGPQFPGLSQAPCAQPRRCSGSCFSARMSYLETSPELAATLQKAQTAWVQFRDANCAYLRSIARPSYADEAFQNCVLRTTIYRRVHLHWSVAP